MSEIRGLMTPRNVLNDIVGDMVHTVKCLFVEIFNARLSFLENVLFLIAILLVGTVCIRGAIGNGSLCRSSFTILRWLRGVTEVLSRGALANGTQLGNSVFPIFLLLLQGILEGIKVATFGNREFRSVEDTLANAVEVHFPGYMKILV